jgi:hypothetical protein
MTSSKKILSVKLTKITSIVVNALELIQLQMISKEEPIAHATSAELRLAVVLLRQPQPLSSLMITKTLIKQNALLAIKQQLVLVLIPKATFVTQQLPRFVTMISFRSLLWTRTRTPTLRTV